MKNLKNELERWDNEVDSLNQSPEMSKVLKTSGWRNHCYLGDGEKMLDLLKNKKIDPKVLLTNGKNHLFDLMDPELASDKNLLAIWDDLYNINAKGVGKGEDLMPLLFLGYDNTGSDCDGKLNGVKMEIKGLGSGCSLKPIKTGLTKPGLVDDLNNEYYNLGKTHKPVVLFNKMKKGTKSTLHSYFSKLYPSKDVTAMVEDIYPLTDRDSFSDKIATQHLKWYKENDGWESIVFIHPETRTLTVLSDLSEVTSLIPYGLKSSIKLKRGKDTQAVADGYSVVSYKK